MPHFVYLSTTQKIFDGSTTEDSSSAALTIIISGPQLRNSQSERPRMLPRIRSVTKPRRPVDPSSVEARVSAADESESRSGRSEEVLPPTKTSLTKFLKRLAAKWTGATPEPPPTRHDSPPGDQLFP